MIKNSISVVLPAYNEAENIKREVEAIFSFLKNNFSDFEIIVVDDGSVDNTFFLCQELEKDFEGKLRIIKHRSNEGYGAALRSGLFSAEGDLVFYTDADNQFNIEDLLKFIDYVDDYDLVIGYRRDRQDKLIRKFVALIYNRMIRLIFGLRIRDIDCSFKLFHKEALFELSIERNNFFIDTELLLKSKLKGYKIKEIGVTHLKRKCGKSTIRPRHVFTTLLDILYFKRKLIKGAL